MKVVIVSKSRVALERDVYAEIARRMRERGADETAVGAFVAAADEFQAELDAYAQSVRE